MILCCGEALIDMISEPTVSGHNGFVPHSGGAVYNTAIALGRLGVRTGMLTGLSSDMFGDQLRAGLEAAGVDCSGVIISDRPTTLAFVTLKEGQASYSFFDENSAGRMLSPSDMPVVSEDVRTLFFGGISLSCEPGAESYAALLAKEGRGRAVMVDPNIRPGFIKDVASYRARLNRIFAAADIAKVSEEDLNWIVPEPISVEDKVQTILAKGLKLVILTMGGKGAAGFLCNGDVVREPATQTTVVDTVGAGDTFNAGVMARLSERGMFGAAGLRPLSSDDVFDALLFGNRIAAVTVSRTGANPPWASEL